MRDIAKELYDQKRYEEAVVVLQQQVEQTWDFRMREGLKLNLAKCLFSAKRAGEAEELISSLSVNVLSDPLTQVDLCLYKTAQGKFQETYNILSKLPVEIPQVAFNLGWHELRHGDFQKGFDLINRGRELNCYGSLHFYNLNKQKLYMGGHHNVIALLMEGGYGDEMIFIRWAKYISQFCNRLDVYCADSLVELFSSLGLNAIDRKYFQSAKYDRFVPAMAIPTLFRIDDPLKHCDLHYLKTNLKKEDLELEGKVKIGIKYKGNEQFEHEQFRMFPTSIYNKLDNYGTLYDLQLEGSDFPNAKSLAGVINSWKDTYCVLDKMDIVVTSCTGVAHLSAAMGKRTIVITPLVPYFVWCNKWYGDNVIVIGQDQYNDWSSVERRLYETLDRIL
jgi:hypothetical protein